MTFPKYVKTIDQKIKYTEEKIRKVKIWLRHCERAVQREAKRLGWTCELTGQIRIINKDIAALQECKDQLKRSKADRRIQKRISGK